VADVNEKLLNEFESLSEHKLDFVIDI
jgi:hypothetical protein